MKILLTLIVVGLSIKLLIRGAKCILENQDFSSSDCQTALIISGSVILIPILIFLYIKLFAK